LDRPALVTRFRGEGLLTYDVALDPVSAEYCHTIMVLPYMQEWIAAAKVEPDELEELDVEF
jgi:glutathione S-transferase